MNTTKTFQEYVETGVVRKRTPDLARADSLRENAKNRKAFIETIVKGKPTDNEANFIIEQVYDTLIALIRARMFEAGFHASGFGAHEAEVSYLEVLNFIEADIVFMNGIRHSRNQILYYGQQFTATYANQVLEFYYKALSLLEKK